MISQICLTGIRGLKRNRIPTELGRIKSQQTSFVVKIDAASLIRLIKQIVTKDGVALAMAVKLVHGQIQEFINQVSAQSGKSMTKQEADYLIALAKSLVVRH